MSCEPITVLRDDLADLRDPVLKEQARTMFERWHTACRPEMPRDEREASDLVAEAWIDGFLAGRRVSATAAGGVR